MFNFAGERDIIDFSPLAGMRRGKEDSRSRVLTDDEIKKLWNCLDMERADIDIYRLTKLALKAILLTGQRPGEVAGMTWEQIDGEWWVIPANRRKNNMENRVPILPMLSSIIEDARVYSGNSPYVFRSSYNEDMPLTVGAMARAILRHRDEMKISERFTPHDLRRTLRTRLAELGISDIVAECILGHKLQGIIAVYNRHTYDTEKRQALAAWEKHLRKILEPSESISNVIPFEVRHATK
jgi:integrase